MEGIDYRKLINENRLWVELENKGNVVNDFVVNFRSNGELIAMLNPLSESKELILSPNVVKYVESPTDTEDKEEFNEWLKKEALCALHEFQLLYINDFNLYFNCFDYIFGNTDELDIDTDDKPFEVNIVTKYECKYIYCAYTNLLPDCLILYPRRKDRYYPFDVDYDNFTICRNANEVFEYIKNECDTDNFFVTTLGLD